MNSTNEIKISVVIPSHNKGKYIQECVNSVLTQSIKELEVICIDDASTDNSLHVLEKLKKNDKRVRLYQNKTNFGPGYSRNLGCTHAQGKYTIFLDADDLYPNTKTLEKLYCCVKNDNTYAAAGNMECFFFDSRSKKSPHSGFLFKKSGIMSYHEYCIRPTWGFTRFLFDSSFIKDNGITFPNTYTYEDPLFFVRYMTKAKKFSFIDDCVYLYRTYGTNHIIDTFALNTILDAMDEILNLLFNVGYKSYYDEYGSLTRFILSHFEYLSSVNQQAEPNTLQKIDALLRKIDFTYFDETIYNIPCCTSFNEFKKKFFFNKVY